MFDKKKYHGEYYKKNKEKIKESIKKYQQSEKGKERIKKYREEYCKRPDVKKRRSDYDKKRYYKDEQNKIYRRINKQIKLCIKIYCRDGKLNVRESVFRAYKILYNIDLYEIINYLKPFPKDIEYYELDHIIPIKEFDLKKRDGIVKAYNKNNLRLLTSRDNLIKGCKI